MSKVARAARVASRQRTETITGAKTIASAETGEIYLFDMPNGADVTITLPAAQEGAYFKFVCTGASDKSVLIDAGSGVTITGAVYTLAVGTSTVKRAAHSDQVLGFGDNHLVGDYAELVCDGTNWHICSAWSGVDWVTS